MAGNQINHNQSTILICLFLTIVTIFIYWQVQYFGFLDCDDNIYITENHHVQRGITLGNFIWAFITTATANWHPLTWLSLMVDYELYGFNASGYHWTNLIFHIVSTLLLFVTMKFMTGELWKSAFVAAIFAVHPLNVESVAWISERKNVLSTFFWFMTMLIYVTYVRRPSCCLYLSALLTFALGLMSKPMLVTLPFVLLLLDYWPLQRFSLGGSRNNRDITIPESPEKEPRSLPIVKIVLEKIPFIILLTMSSIVTVYAAKHGGAIRSLNMFPFEHRLANALVSYSGYLEKMLWPCNLTIFYPYENDIFIGKIIWSCFLIASITVLAVYWAKQYRYLSVGWLWYMGTLVPVIGFVQIGYQSMADRYSYVPLIGVYVMLTWGISDVLVKLKWRWQNVLLAVVAFITIISLMICSWLQVRYWQNSFSVYQRALDTTRNNYKAHYGMGNFYLSQENIAKAAENYLEALRIRPDYADVRINLGIVYMKQGKYEEAEYQYKEALKEITPYTAKAYNNLGIVLALQGKIDDAISQFRIALTLDPDDMNAKNNLSITLDMKQKQGGS